MFFLFPLIQNNKKLKFFRIGYLHVPSELFCFVWVLEEKSRENQGSQKIPKGFNLIIITWQGMKANYSEVWEKIWSQENG